MMAWFPLSLLTLLILSLSPPSTSSTSLQFPTEYSLSGDAHFSGDKDSDSGSVQLTRPNPSSSGIIFHTTPFKLTSTTSFSSNFTFKIGNRLALVIIPSGFASKLAKNISFEQLDETQFVKVEFDHNLCKVSSSRVSNVSIMTYDMKTGVKLTAWVDYIAILKRVDVRVTELGLPKPAEPLVSYRVDLGEMWKGEEVVLGLVSDNGENEEIAVVYSWSFGIKEVPKWMHSMPVIPKEHSKVEGNEGLKNDSESEGCGDFGFILAIGCGAFAGWIVSHVWSYFVDRRKVQGEGEGEGEGEGYVCPFGFRYVKIGVVKANDLETGMK